MSWGVLAVSVNIFHHWPHWFAQCHEFSKIVFCLLNMQLSRMQQMGLLFSSWRVLCVSVYIEFYHWLAWSICWRHWIVKAFAFLPVKHATHKMDFPPFSMSWVALHVPVKIFSYWLLCIEETEISCWLYQRFEKIWLIGISIFLLPFSWVISGTHD